MRRIDLSKMSLTSSLHNWKDGSATFERDSTEETHSHRLSGHGSFHRGNTVKWFFWIQELATFLATSVRNCLLSHVHPSILEWSLGLTVSLLTDSPYDNRGRSLSIPHTYKDI